MTLFHGLGFRVAFYMSLFHSVSSLSLLVLFIPSNSHVAGVVCCRFLRLFLGVGFGCRIWLCRALAFRDGLGWALGVRLRSEGLRVWGLGFEEVRRRKVQGLRRSGAGLGSRYETP